MKILIIEDDKNSARLMCIFLKQYGACDIAQDGLMGLEYVSKALADGLPYDLVMVDIMMPHLNGLDTLRAIRTMENKYAIPKDKQVKAIMTSALESDGLRIEAYESGCLAYVRKPINFELLKAILMDEFSGLGLDVSLEPTLLTVEEV